MAVDRIVISVMHKFADRAEAGEMKYGTNLERTDLTTLEWINHAQEEAMDFVLYLERLKQEIENIKEFDAWKEWKNESKS